MKQEIALLIAFLVVFLCDTFASPKAAKSVPVVGCLWMAAIVAFGFVTIPGED